MNRYSRQTILNDVGEGGQEKLLAAKVLVVGAGGLGCPILQYLTAAGVGTIGIIDGDVVEESNLQRQILFTENELGLKKVVCAKEKLSPLNSGVRFVTYDYFLSAENALDIFSHYDLIIDGSDNFSTRYLVNDAAVICGKTFISGSILKFEGQVSVYNYNNGPTYRCLFPEPPSAGEIPSCSEAGVIGGIAGIAGSMMVMEAVKIILKINSVLSGKLWIYDALALQTRILEFEKSDPFIAPVSLESFSSSCYNFNLSSSDFLSRSSGGVLIDVRESEEHKLKNIGGINIPLSDFEQRLPEIKTQEVFIYCQRGARGAKAVEIAKSRGLIAWNLQGGIAGLNF